MIDIRPLIQETQKTNRRRDDKKSTLRHTVFQLQKTKDKTFKTRGKKNILPIG